jgi:6-phosphogluconolactonase
VSIDIQVVDDPARACAVLLIEAARTGGHIVLTGGSTPKAAYELAAATPEAWAGAKLWFTDDRCVAPDDDLSNYALVKAALLDPIAAAGVEIGFCRRVMGEHGPEEGAADYEHALAEHGDGAAGPEFELVLIGVGSDAHICSMFPGQESLAETKRFAVGVPVAGLEPFVPRVTLTFPALARAKRAVVLATGSGKADAISAAFADDAPATPQKPASLLREHVREITVLLDDAAAARL